MTFPPAQFHFAKYQFSCLQNLPSCSINIQSFQKLPKICSTWSLWCKENEAPDGEHTTGHFNPTCDQSTSQSSISSTRVPPKLPRHHRKMPFRRRAWCGCFQVSKKIVCLLILNVRSFDTSMGSRAIRYRITTFRYYRQFQEKIF